MSESWKLQPAPGNKDNSLNNVFVKELFAEHYNKLPSCWLQYMIFGSVPTPWKVRGGLIWSSVDSWAPAMQQLLRKRNFTVTVWALQNCIAHIFINFISMEAAEFPNGTVLTAASELFLLTYFFLPVSIFPTKRIFANRFRRALNETLSYGNDYFWQTVKGGGSASLRTNIWKSGLEIPGFPNGICSCSKIPSSCVYFILLSKSLFASDGDAIKQLLEVQQPAS